MRLCLVLILKNYFPANMYKILMFQFISGDIQYCIANLWMVWYYGMDVWYYGKYLYLEMLTA